MSAETKSPLASKVIWINGLTILIDGIGHFSGVIPSQAQPYIAMGLGVANVVLRFLTGQPIG